MLAALVTLASATASAKSGQARTHDGFHLSLGVGPAFMSTGLTLDPEPAVDLDSRASGPGFSGMLLIGGTIAERTVIGGGSMGGHFVRPTISSDIGDVESDSDLVCNLIGPYVAWWPGSDSGLWVFGLLGAATLEDGSDATDGLAVGFGLGAGVGWAWWVGDSWGIGALARVQVMRTSVGRSETAPGAADVTYRYLTVLPSLNLTATFH